jgi:hypothetical protein
MVTHRGKIKDIEAFQVGVDSVPSWLEDLVTNELAEIFYTTPPEIDYIETVQFENGTATANPGDYIINDADPFSISPSHTLVLTEEEFEWLYQPVNLSREGRLDNVAFSGDYDDLSDKPTIPAAQVNSDWNSVSGVSQILNKPTINSGTVTSVTAGTGLSGGTITSSGTISMPNTGTAGTYRTVTTDAQGRITSGSNPSFSNNVSRTLNSNYTISASLNARVNYSINITWNVLINTFAGAAFLEYSTNSGSSWITVNQCGRSQAANLTSNGTDDLNLTGEIPANALVRIRTTATNCTVTYNSSGSQEVTY